MALSVAQSQRSQIRVIRSFFRIWGKLHYTIKKKSITSLNYLSINKRRVPEMYHQKKLNSVTKSFFLSNRFFRCKKLQNTFLHYKIFNFYFSFVGQYQNIQYMFLISKIFDTINKIPYKPCKTTVHFYF